MRARSPFGRGPRGFTLVELMVAMAITGIFAVVAYTMFDRSSGMLKEVDELSDVQDRMRFALERLRGDLQMAGALSTPDSGPGTRTTDPWVQPLPNDPQLIKTASDRWRVAAIVPYDGWQDGTDGYSAEIIAANSVGGVVPFSSDGVVIMGAIDYPLPFEVSGFQRSSADTASGTAGADKAVIRAHQRGLGRLHSMDPFRTGMGYVGTDTTARIDLSVEKNRGWLEPGFETRIMRVRDRQGYMQFVNLLPYDAADPLADNAIGLEFDKSYHPPFFKTESSSTNGKMQTVGLDDGQEGMADAGYDAAFIDAYWYHVRVDPGDPRNSQLVRTRLCASHVARAVHNGLDSFDPATAIAPAGTTTNRCPKAGAPLGAKPEVVVIADNVVDFQIWFDCAGANGNITGADWGMAWNAPDETDMTCLSTTPGSYDPGLVRMGHVRLSLRAATERADVTNSMFENMDGVATSAGEGLQLLRTFNIAGPLMQDGAPAPGAAAVVTLQTDFELPNVANANQLATTAVTGTP